MGLQRKQALDLTAPILVIAAACAASCADTKPVCTAGDAPGAAAGTCNPIDCKLTPPVLGRVGDPLSFTLEVFDQRDELSSCFYPLTGQKPAVFLSTADALAFLNERPETCIGDVSEEENPLLLRLDEWFAADATNVALYVGLESLDTREVSVDAVRRVGDDALLYLTYEDPYASFVVDEPLGSRGASCQAWAPVVVLVENGSWLRSADTAIRRVNPSCEQLQNPLPGLGSCVRNWNNWRKTPSRPVR